MNVSFDNTFSNSMKISKKWWASAELYKHFTKGFQCKLDFSNKSATLMYAYESTGYPKIEYSQVTDCGHYNGFAVGKHLMDVTIAMWAEDLQAGIITKHELLDADNPHKLNRIIEDIIL